MPGDKGPFGLTQDNSEGPSHLQNSPQCKPRILLRLHCSMASPTSESYFLPIPSTCVDSKNTPEENKCMLISMSDCFLGDSTYHTTYHLSLGQYLPGTQAALPPCPYFPMLAKSLRCLRSLLICSVLFSPFFLLDLSNGHLTTIFIRNSSICILLIKPTRNLHFTDQHLTRVCICSQCQKMPEVLSRAYYGGQGW